MVQRKTGYRQAVKALKVSEGPIQHVKSKLSNRLGAGQYLSAAMVPSHAC